MRISGYGVVLSALSQERIEMARQWRNSENINRYMEYRQFITPEMQQKWFENLNALTDHYFVIEYDSTPIGLIHTSNIDWDTLTGNAGLFIFDERYIGTPIPVLASLSMVDIMFGIFPLKYIYAKVMRDNEVAVRYNLNLGFVSEAGEEGKPFQRYVLTREAYYRHTREFRRSAKLEADQVLEVEIPADQYYTLQERKLISDTSSGISLLVSKSVAL